MSDYATRYVEPPKVCMCQLVPEQMTEDQYLTVVQILSALEADQEEYRARMVMEKLMAQ